MISNLTILGMVFTILVCFVLPLIVMMVLKIRMRAKILLFLAGISMQILFVMLLERLFISLMARTTPAFVENDFLYPLVLSLAAGIFESLEFALAVRILRDHMDGGSRVVMFGIGHGGANAALSSGLTSMTYYSVAVIANANGKDYLTQGLSGDELTFMQGMLDYLDSSSWPFYISGIEQFALMMVYCCAAVIMWMAMTERLSRKWAGASAGMIFVFHLFMNFGNYEVSLNSLVSAALCLLIGIAAVVFTRMLYVKIEGDHPRQERMPVRRLR